MPECRLVRQYSNFFALKYVEKHVSLKKRTVSMVSLELCSSFAELAFVRDVSESSVKSAAVITRDTDVKISEQKKNAIDVSQSNLMFGIEFKEVIVTLD